MREGSPLSRAIREPVAWTFAKRNEKGKWRSVRVCVSFVVSVFQEVFVVLNSEADASDDREDVSTRPGPVVTLGGGLGEGLQRSSIKRPRYPPP